MIYDVSGNSSDPSPYSVTVLGCLFVNNTSTAESAGWGGGGAIYHNGLAVLRVIDSVFINNTSAGYGGAINLLGLDSAVTIHSSVFIGNSGSSACCEVLLDHDVMLYLGRVFAAQLGGAVASYEGDQSASVTVTESWFEGNTASDGGAIYVFTPGTVLINNVTALNNTAGIMGGAISLHTPNSSVYFTASLVAVIEDSSFILNSAPGTGSASGATL